MQSQKPNNITTAKSKLTKRGTIIMLLALMLTLPQMASAQLSGAPSFSPYTIYGLGDMAVGGSAFNRAMGGVGVAYRNFSNFNYLNPASLSAMSQHSAVFNFGGEGQNIYARSAKGSTSYNSFNIHDIGLAVPLARGIGIGFSMNPVSTIGYSTQIVDTTKSIANNVGNTIYSYTGDGGITQINASFGMHVVRGLSLGVTMHYWFGLLDRQFSAQVSPYFSNDSYRTVFTSQATRLSKVLYSVGAQYMIPVGKQKENFITIGATFQPRFTANTRYNNETITTDGKFVDTVNMSRTDSRIAIPSKIAAGVYYHSERFGVGMDYVRQDWSGAFDIPSDQNIGLRAQQEFKVGAQFTPDPHSMRNALKRWTYKVGARYGTSYLTKDGQLMHDIAITLGVDVPLIRSNPSKLGVGFELGSRGKTSYGQIRENYFKVFVALNFFASDWFVRYKYN